MQVWLDREHIIFCQLLTFLFDGDANGVAFDIGFNGVAKLFFLYNCLAIKNLFEPAFKTSYCTDLKNSHLWNWIQFLTNMQKHNKTSGPVKMFNLSNIVYSNRRQFGTAAVTIRANFQ